MGAVIPPRMRPVAVAAGILLAAAALLGDALGAGSSSAFGWKQLALLVLAAGLIAVGLIGGPRAAAPDAREALRAAARLLREHRALAGLVALSALVRAAVAAAYWPAYLTTDSYTYIRMAHGPSFVAAEPDRPSGYPLILDLLAATGSRLASVTLAQHAAGLVIGVLVYALLLRLGSRRWLALLAAAALLLGADLVLAAEFLMAETFFALALAGSAYLAAGRERGPAALAASGALLAIAVTIRTAGLFAIPVWLAYVCWTHRRRRPVAAGAAALALPLLAYCAWHATETDRFGFTDAEGWFLYGRVAEFADCGEADVPAETRLLCVRPTAEALAVGPAFFVFNPDSPARRAFGGVAEPDLERRRRANALLRDFAVAAIVAQPDDYARTVGRDFLDFFRSTREGRPFQASVDRLEGYGRDSRAEQVRYVVDIRERHLPGWTPRAAAPKEAVEDYARVLWIRPALLGALAAAALLAMLAGAIGRRRGWVPRRREIALLAGMALAMLLGSTATSDYAPRYMTPVVPLIVAAGLLALEDLAGLRSLAREQVEPTGTSRTADHG